MKHEEHICRFNDGEQSCDCYDEGYEKAKADIKKSITGVLRQIGEVNDDDEMEQVIKVINNIK